MVELAVRPLVIVADVFLAEQMKAKPYRRRLREQAARASAR